MTKKLCKLWVDSDFKKMVKSQAAEQDMSIIDYTAFLANNKEQTKNENKKKKLEFFF